MIVAVVPLKALHQSKSRLAAHISPEERSTLMLALVERTVAVLRHCAAIHRVALATPETTLAARLEVDLIPDRGSLNRAIADGSAWASSLAATGLLVIPADLPYLSAPDVEQLIRSAPPPPSVVIAPTHDGGTGALFLQPPAALPPHFGQDSFARHTIAATELGVRVHELHLAGFATDLDTLTDLKRYQHTDNGSTGRTHPSTG
jgi:2-phospho-L-lactate/phosphoenolpyruvate guanylyltransferase